ncbi:MAG: hypothetical protein QM754_12860 [Tepidisphaeraceae bacterium]
MQYDFQNRMWWLIGFVAAIGITIPESIGGGAVDHPHPLRILVTLALLGLGILYALRSIWAEPGDVRSRSSHRETWAVLAFIFMYVQIWFLKNEQVMRRYGPWHVDMLWPSGAVLVFVVLYGVLTAKKRQSAVGQDTNATLRTET